MQTKSRKTNVFDTKIIKSDLQLKINIALIFKNKQYWNEKGLIMISPLYFRQLLGLRNKDLVYWAQSDKVEHKKMLNTYNEAIEFLCANLTQDMINNPTTANYRLSLLKTYSIDFKELAEQQQNYVETKININLSKKGTNSILKNIDKESDI